jgi:choline dehydrogenase-like flavoprotein
VETQAPRQLQDHFNLLYGASARTLRPGRGRKYLPKIGISEDVQRRERVLNCVGQLEYEYSPNSAMVALKNLVIALHMGRRPERVASTAIKVALASPLLAHHAYRFAARGLTPSVKPARIYLDAISEQAPNPDSRVTLGSTLDKLGLRQARVDWQLRGLDWRTLLVFAKSVQAEFSRLGLGNVKITEWLAEGDMSQAHVRDNFHPAGTTRLAERARDGVVDTNCQVFGVDGLYIAGSSIFPTSGTANPVLTITAMALRLSDHLKVKLVAAPELSVPVTA